MGAAAVLEALAPLAALAVLLAAPGAVAAFHRNRSRPLDPSGPGLAPRLAGAVRLAAEEGLEVRLAPAPAEGDRAPPPGRLVGGILGRPAAILSEDLLRAPPELAEAVLAHEAAHWRLGHPRWLLFIAAACLLAVRPAALALSGIAGPWYGTPAALAALALAWRIASGMADRRFEAEADAAAAGVPVRGAVPRIAIAAAFVAAAALWAHSVVRASTGS